MPYENKKFKQRMISRIRREWHWSAEKKEALKNAETEEGYICAVCDGIFPKKQVQVDHIIPVVDPDLGFQGFDMFINRMFCPAHSLRVACKECHKGITKEQNLARNVECAEG